MSVNRYKPHVYVIPEDDADRQLADGFVLHPALDTRAVQVVAPAHGWSRVFETYEVEYIPLLRRQALTHVIMLIDFDEHPDRMNWFDQRIPPEFKRRTFVIGSRSHPEALRQELGQPFEAIGQALASECQQNVRQLWDHPLLQHNGPEVERMMADLKPFLFLP